MNVNHAAWAFMLCALSPNISIAEDNPAYSASTSRLSIPYVDSSSQPGFYQNVVVEFFKDDLWRLVDFRTGVSVKVIANVELIKTESFPVQVFLKISGMNHAGCSEVGSANTSISGNKFKVFLYYDPKSIPAADVACLGWVRPFTKTVPLPVYSLQLGRYEYEVNGIFRGEFTLAVDNRLP